MPEHLETAADPLADFDLEPIVARLETDRFCDGCGYNLHTQAVRRDARTQLLLCRCPECGRFHSVRDGGTAGRVWLQRLGTLGLFWWVLGVLGVGLALSVGQLVLTLATLDELTTYKAQPVLSTKATQLSGRAWVSGGQTWTREPREEIPRYGRFMALILAGAFSLGLALALLLVVTMHHWRRWGYLIVAGLIPLGIGVFSWYIWVCDWPRLSHWVAGYASWIGAANMLGGLVGVYLGRPLARLLVTLVLPPRIRQVLAFLWLADGKLPPKPA